ncbi:SWIB complex BAF60b domain-containing protein [Trifolium repens]|nr:SWIB complex BAF60b domain-containing protein [Trifolium repens]
MVITEEEISEAIHSLFTESNPRTRTFTTLNQVVQELQSKLGHDLTHKLDFITSQINLLFASQQQQQQHRQLQQQQQQQPPPQPQPQQPQQLLSFQNKDHFALHQNPNPHSVPVATSVFRNNPITAASADALAAQPPPLSPNVVPKESAQPKPKRRGGPGGLNKLCGVSPELQVIVGQPAMPRTEIVKQLWAYIKKNNLQDPNNKRKIICNDELRVVFETDCTDMFKMNKLLAKHIIALEPTKKPAPKKQKVEVELGTRSAEPTPSVIISDSLANFFGVTGREMLQSEVLRRIWEYIKVNHLEDPVNPMAIMCDAKLQEIFGCESISALGIPEVLGRHHIFRRS